MHPWLYSFLYFILAVGLLTTIHEYGHFIVARKLGITVLRFSVGFGPAWLKWYDRHGTEYTIAPIPLGGYVKLLDEREQPVPRHQVRQAFNRKPVWARLLVLIAGPGFNLLFAVLAYWLLFFVGTTEIKPITGPMSQSSIAVQAGLRANQEILSIDGTSTASWEAVSMALMQQMTSRHPFSIVVRDLGTQAVSTHQFNAAAWVMDKRTDDVFELLGLRPFDPVEPIVAKVLQETPAMLAGFQQGDRIIAINTKPVTNRQEIGVQLKNQANKQTELTVLRDGVPLTLTLTPEEKVNPDGSRTGFLGIQYEVKPWPENMLTQQRQGLLTALGSAVAKTASYTRLTLDIIVQMVVGNISPKQVSGPITIAKFAGDSAQSGWVSFVGFLALVSISLGVLNLLPVPILDGGQVVYCLAEGLVGRPLSERTQEVGRMCGLVILFALMGLALYNDIMRLVF